VRENNKTNAFVGGERRDGESVFRNTKGPRPKEKEREKRIAESMAPQGKKQYKEAIKEKKEGNFRGKMFIPRELEQPMEKKKTVTRMGSIKKPFEGLQKNGVVGKFEAS